MLGLTLNCIISTSNRLDYTEVPKAQRGMFASTLILIGDQEIMACNDHWTRGSAWSLWSLIILQRFAQKELNLDPSLRHQKRKDFTNHFWHSVLILRYKINTNFLQGNTNFLQDNKSCHTLGVWVCPHAGPISLPKAWLMSLRGPFKEELFKKRICQWREASMKLSILFK